MNENSENFTENRGEDAIRAREQSPQKMSEKPVKKSKTWLPIVIIVVILAAVTTVALILGGTNSDGGSTLSNNINDTGVNWEKYDGS